jgi:hypothetical protein
MRTLILIYVWSNANLKGVNRCRQNTETQPSRIEFRNKPSQGTKRKNVLQEQGMAVP